MAKRMIAVLLLAVMAISIFSGCSSKQSSTEGETTVGIQTEQTEESTAVDYFATLPSQDFNGGDFTILCRTSKVYEIATDAENGEVVNDAIFRRNVRISDVWNVNIKYIDIAGEWSDAGAFQNTVLKAVKAGDAAYDAVAVYQAYGVPLASQGAYVALNKVPSFDASHEWWVQSFIENNTVYGNFYYTIGDYSLTMWEGIYALFFNKKLVEDYNIENLYDLVKGGKWTLDRLIEYSVLVTQDIDGNGKYDEADKYGFLTNDHSMRAVTAPFQMPIAARNAEGEYELVFYNERTISIFNRLYEFVNENVCSYVLPASVDHAGGAYLSPMFMEDRGLFMTYTLEMTELLRDMKSDYGIIPLPKYDEAQTEYMSLSYDGASIFAIPVSSKDYEFSALMLEALSAESKNTVIPAFYDTKLMTKIVRDNDSAEMLDIIRKNLNYDFAFIHNMSLDYIFSIFGDMIASKDKTFVSTYEKRAKTINTKMLKLMADYQATAENQG